MLKSGSDVSWRVVRYGAALENQYVLMDVLAMTKMRVADGGVRRMPNDNLSVLTPSADQRSTPDRWRRPSPYVQHLRKTC